MAISLASKMACSSLVLFGMIGAAVFGGNELSKTTISDSLGEVKLVSEKTTDNIEETLWTSLVYFSLLKKEAKSEKFKNLSSDWKTKITVNNNNFWTPPENLNQASQDLKQLCENSRNENYSSWFSTDDDLMEDVKNFCSAKIIDIFSWHGASLNFSEENYKNEEKDLWTKNLKSLKAVQNLDNESDSELSGIKNSIPEDLDSSEESHKKLFNWCKVNMDFYYMSKEESKINLIVEYCKKTIEIGTAGQ